MHSWWALTNMYTHVTTSQSICRTFSSFKKVTPCPFAVTSLTSPPNGPLFYYASLQLNFVYCHIMEPYSKYSYVSGFFSTKYSQNIILLSSMQLHILIIYIFITKYFFIVWFITVHTFSSWWVSAFFFSNFSSK